MPGSEPRGVDPVRVVLIGAGQRGADTYGRAVTEAGPNIARVVAVAEPDATRRDRAAGRFGLAPEHRFASWEALLATVPAEPPAGGAAPGLAVIATPDHAHVAPAVAALRAGWHLLLEKPIAPDADGVRTVETAAREASGSVTVAHVLRHAPFFTALKRLLTQGAIGRAIGMDHVENVGFWHFAHAYVRGHWRRSDRAAPMLLAKACHDLDLLRWLADAPCDRVHSEGALRWFRPEHAPAGAPERCSDGCPVQAACPFDAERIYLRRFAGDAGWPRSVLAGDLDGDDAAVADALTSGPYGRCVYRCDNDVCDHQTVTATFANGFVATLTVTAFSEENTRTVRIFGTHGEIEGHLGTGRIALHEFASGTTVRHDVAPADGHADADRALLLDLLGRLRDGSGPGPTALATS
ncbi:MAG: Gfo/Idh/MocA family oxidoreductase, partial [Trueperaceae bacterium]